MDAAYYQTIFKRKSFHLFHGVGAEQISGGELSAIRETYAGFESLYPDIRTAIRIVPAEKVNFKRDAEYCIMLYSEKKDNYLMNAGYIGEQLDLYLVAHDIGSLWYGIGKADEPTYEGLDFVIMIAIHKVSDVSKYRRDLFKAKRKPLEEIWTGETLGVGEIARFAPSACNSQPWLVKNDSGILTVSRYQKPGKSGLMTPAAAEYFNRVDMGIFLCILEICMSKKQITAERTLYVDELSRNESCSKVAEYRLTNPVT